MAIEHISEYEPIIGNVTAARPAKRYLLETGQPIPSRRVRRMQTGPAIPTRRAQEAAAQRARMVRVAEAVKLAHALGVPLETAQRYLFAEKP